MQEVLEIIFNYSKKGKLLDENAVKKIIPILKNEYYLLNTSYIVDRTIYLNTNKITMGKYNYDNDLITIYIDRIFSYVYHHYHMTRFDCEFSLSNFEINLRNNLYILEVILHEFEHALQDKKIYSPNSNSQSEELEQRIIRIEAFNAKSTNEADTIYHLSVLERLANINSKEKCIKLLTSSDKEYDELLSLLNKILLHKMIIDYEEYESPTIRLMEILLEKKIDSIELKSNILSKYDYDTRIKLGLYLTEYEKKENFMMLNKRR